MRKLIRHTVTGACFCKGNWVDDFHFGQLFNTYDDASKCVEQYELTDVEFRFIYGDVPSTHCDWAMPLV